MVGQPGANRLDQLSHALAMLRFDQRKWDVLELRVGLGSTYTLAECGELLGITRERVRQIQQKSVKRALSQISSLVPVLDFLECAAPKSWTHIGKSDQRGSIQEIVRMLGGTEDVGDHLTNVRHLLMLVRAFVDYQPDWAKHYPRLTFAACSIDPPIGAHKAVAAAIAEYVAAEREATRDWTYEELAEAVLRKVGAPLHWSEIADQSESMGRRRNFSRSAFFNELQRSDDKFARVDSGTYGLTAWGLQDVSTYTDIVAEILGGVGHALPEGAIYQAVTSRRPVDRNSLRMLLDLNPRFYRSMDGIYGLRAWLPARHLQTLRTPRWKVEDAKSYRRVERSIVRGYDVESMVERDELQYPSN